MEATAVKEQQFDWTETNLQSIASLRMSLAHQFKKDGLTASRAMNAASDRIARELMTPPKTGQELDQWIAQAMTKIRHGRQKVEVVNGNGNGHHKNGNGNGHTHASGILSAVGVDFSIPEGLTPPVPSQKVKGEKWAAVIAVMKDAALNEWKPLLFKDVRDTKVAAGVLGYHARNSLKCQNYGWRLKSKVDRNNPGLLWFIKQKIG